MSKLLPLLEWLVLAILIAYSLRTVWRHVAPKPLMLRQRLAAAPAAAACKGCHSGCKN